MKKILAWCVSLLLMINMIPNIAFAKENNSWSKYAIVALGSGGIKIDKNARINGNIYSSGSIELGKNQQNVTDIFSEDNATLDKNTNIYGSLYSNGEISVDKNVNISEGKFENANVSNDEIYNSLKVSPLDKSVDGVVTSNGETSVQKNINVTEVIAVSSKKITIDKNVTLNGGIYAPNGNIKIDKNAKIYGLVYAPKGVIEIDKNAVIRGCIIGSEIKIGKNVDITYEGIEDLIKPDTNQQLKDEIQIKVSDSKGIVEEFNNTVDGNNKNFTEKKVLKGQAQATFSINSDSYDKLQYNIVKSVNAPNINSITEWNEINKDKTQYIDDVFLDRRGFLNHQSYDVTGLKDRKEEDKWNTPSIVYKTPYPTSSIISAEKAKDQEKYGNKQGYIDSSNIRQERWINKTIFLDNTFIGDNYKEASKIWGYFTVEQDGEYNFRSYSDDGLKAYIIVNGEKVHIVDEKKMFKVQGKTGYEYNINGKVANVKLTKGKFYPIYIEYFNWGGSACLEMQYKLKGASTYAQIPASAFYPSRSNSPSEYAESRFEGVDGKSFPNEQGTYYVAYKASSSKDSSKVTKGVIGPFSIESRANLEILRSIYTVDGKKLEKNSNGVYVINENKFKIKYEIKPKNISAEDMVGTSTDISNTIVETILPNGLIFKNKDENKVINDEGTKTQNNIPISKIEYYFDKEENVYKPKTQSASYSHTIEAKNFGEYLLGESSTVISYIDLDGAKREYRFNNEKIYINGELDIIQNGIYDIKTSSFQDVKKVNALVPLNLAVDIWVKSSDPSIKFSSNAVNGHPFTLKKYELDENKKIITNTEQTKNINQNSFELSSENNFKFELNKKYRIIYTLKPSLNKDFEVSVLNKNSVGQSLKIQSIAPPILK